MATRFKHRLAFVIPAPKKGNANTLLSRHGLGSDNFCVDAVDKADVKANPTVTHAVCAVVADDATVTILRKVCGGVDPTFKEKPRPVDPSLDMEGLKRKPAKIS